MENNGGKIQWYESESTETGKKQIMKENTPQNWIG